MPPIPSVEIIFEKLTPAVEVDGPNRPKLRSRAHRSEERQECSLANKKSMISEQTPPRTMRTHNHTKPSRVSNLNDGSAPHQKRGG